MRAYLAMAIGTSLIAQVVRPVAHLTGYGAFICGMGLYCAGIAIVWAIQERG